MNITQLLTWATLVHATFIKYQNKLYPIGAGVCFVLGTILILVAIFFSKAKPVQSKSTQSSTSFSKAIPSSVPQEIISSRIQVDIAGAVVKPGVYELQSQERLLAAIEAAGGFDSKVNKQYVAKFLNLSQQLNDQQKIYIPFHGERIDDSLLLSSAQSPKSSVTSTSNTNSTSKLINVNTASQAELETLTGVGEVRAQNMISGRPFKSLQELVQKGILTQKILNDNKEKIGI